MSSRRLTGPASTVRAHLRGQPLSERELRVLAAFARGLPRQQTAELLGMRELTVKSHAQRIAAKLGTTGLGVEASIATAYRSGQLFLPAVVPMRGVWAPDGDPGFLVPTELTGAAS